MRRAEVSVVSAAVAAALVVSALVGASQNVVQPATSQPQATRNDFVFADVYGRARARGDLARMARVADAYVPYMESVFTHFENVSRAFLGYEVRQVLLLHANELNADYLDDLIGMLRRRGYRFVDLDTALDDPAYTLPEAQAARGLSWLHRWMLAKGLPMQAEPAEPAEPAFIRELFEQPRE